MWTIPTTTTWVTWRTNRPTTRGPPGPRSSSEDELDPDGLRPGGGTNGGVAVEVCADRGPLTGLGGPWNAGGYPAHADWASYGGVAMDILCGTGN